MKINGAIFKGMGALLALGLLTGCDGGGAESGFSGYVEAELVYVAAPDAGWIVEAPLREGDAATAGDILFRLDQDRQEAARDEAKLRKAQAAAQARDLATGARAEEIAALKAQLAEAEAAKKNARVARDRAKSLSESGVGTQSRLDDANAAFDEAAARVRAIEANIATAMLAGREEARKAAEAARDAAEAALRQAQWALDQRSVAARVDGRVEQVFLRKGEFATAGAPVLSILPPEGLKIRFFVPEAKLRGVTPGAEVMVRADPLAQPIRARITFVAAEAEYTPPVIYSASSREKLVFMVEAKPEMRGPGAKGADAESLRKLLRPGLPVDVTPP